MTRDTDQTWRPGGPLLAFEGDGALPMTDVSVALGFEDTPHEATDSAAIVATSLGPVTISLYQRLEDVADIWTAFESHAICTYAQTFAWIEGWSRLVGARRQSNLAIVLGTDDKGSHLFIWPFELTSIAGVKSLSWLGEDFANYNMGLHDAEFAASVTRRDMVRLIGAAAKALGGVATIRLSHQPFAWQGMPNPFAKLTHQKAANAGYAVRLEADFEALVNRQFGKRSRQTLSRKARRLKRDGTVRMGWARDTQERALVLQAFHAQKTAWFAENGIEDMFSAAGVWDFYQSMATLDAKDASPLELGYLSVDDQIVATFCGVRFRDRFNLVQSSITSDEMKRFSPGQQLLAHQIAACCAEGLSHYDLGVGWASHKDDWCNEKIALFDTYKGLSLTGRSLAAFFRARSALKRYIKSHPNLWAAARRARRAIFVRDPARAP